MVEVSEEFLKDVRTLVDYSYEDECKHCEEDNGIEFQDDGSIICVASGQPVKVEDFGKHVFFSIRKIDEFLSAHKKKPEFLSISTRAHSAITLFVIGGFSFSYLFNLVGLNSGIGTIVGAIIGGISGYFIGRRMENKEDA